MFIFSKYENLNLNSIKPYRSVKPRPFFSMGSFPRQSGQTKIFKYLYIRLKLKNNNWILLFKRKKIKRHNCKYFCLAALSRKRTHREKYTRLYASVRFNGIHCTVYAHWAFMGNTYCDENFLFTIQRWIFFFFVELISVTFRIIKECNYKLLFLRWWFC